MSILISARGQYVVLNNSLVNGTFDNLRDAVSSVRMQGKQPVYTWDYEE